MIRHAFGVVRIDLQQAPGIEAGPFVIALIDERVRLLRPAGVAASSDTRL